MKSFPKNQEGNDMWMAWDDIPNFSLNFLFGNKQGEFRNKANKLKEQVNSNWNLEGGWDEPTFREILVKWSTNGLYPFVRSL